MPGIVADAGDDAARRFLEFFGATIQNKNTRAAYYRAEELVFAWCNRRRITQLARIEPLHVAADIEGLQETMEKPTVKPAYLEGGGTLENAQLMAAHESPRTTETL